MVAVKVIKVIGTSPDSWEAAAREAVARASETVSHIHGVEVESWTAEVEGSEIVEYKATVEVAFPVERQD
jgi:flavin-binding protein dodecin